VSFILRYFAFTSCDGDLCFSLLHLLFRAYYHFGLLLFCFALLRLFALLCLLSRNHSSSHFYILISCSYAFFALPHLLFRARHYIFCLVWLLFLARLPFSKKKIKVLFQSWRRSRSRPQNFKVDHNFLSS
jgi:hypothetical protein